MIINKEAIINKQKPILDNYNIDIDKPIDQSKTFPTHNNTIKIINNTIKNPKQIETVIKGATYMVPTFKIKIPDALNNVTEPVLDNEDVEIKFCKGNSKDENSFRQAGFFTETLIMVAKQYLIDVNEGDLYTQDTANAIMKLEEALMQINKRSEDRKLRSVQTTYDK